MKKLLFALALVAAMMFTSCENEEPTQQLSEYVIGEWESEDVLLGETTAHFLVDIEAGFFTLTLVVGEESAESPKEAYTVDNEANIITIDQPQFPGDEPSDEKIPFNVTWIEGGTTMTWVPVNSGEEDGPPIIVWTKI